MDGTLKRAEEHHADAFLGRGSTTHHREELTTCNQLEDDLGEAGCPR